MEQLLEEYSSNCNMANALALETVSKIEIPICNRISTLFRQDFIKLLHKFPHKCKLLTAPEICLLLTLLTDAVTIMIKNQDLYESFQGSNSYLIDILCRQSEFMTFMLAKGYADQMLKYVERIPEYSKLQECLNEIRLLNVFKSFTPSEFYKVNPINISKDSKDVSKENNPPKTLKRKIEPTTTINNNVRLKIINVTPKNDIIPLKKPRNAFEILMNSGKKKQV